jgi:hypothetical protein
MVEIVKTDYDSEDVMFEGSHIASLVEDGDGVVTVEYGSRWDITRTFKNRDNALTWLNDNAGDLADPDYRDDV